MCRKKIFAREGNEKNNNREEKTCSNEIENKSDFIFFYYRQLMCRRVSYVRMKVKLLLIMTCNNTHTIFFEFFQVFIFLLNSTFYFF